ARHWNHQQRNGEVPHLHVLFDERNQIVGRAKKTKQWRNGSKANRRSDSDEQHRQQQTVSRKSRRLWSMTLTK
ncbi:hypothetical protein D039_4859B, partial [Vibrio parahaemolyticus EKP-028]